MNTDCEASAPPCSCILAFVRMTLRDGPSPLRPPQQVDQLLPPEFRPGVGAVAARVAGGADEDVAAGLHPPRRILGNAVAGGVDEIVLAVHPDERRRSPER